MALRSRVETGEDSAAVDSGGIIRNSNWVQVK